jgi:hypothetical protein
MSKLSDETLTIIFNLLRQLAEGIENQERLEFIMTDQNFYPDDETKQRCIDNLRQSNRQLDLYNLFLDDAIAQIDLKLRQYKRKRLSPQEYQTPSIEI